MNTTATDTFGAKVEEYRERLGMLQKELAEQSGLSRSHLNRIEKGTRKRPHVDALRRMVSALRLTRDEAHGLVQLAGLSPRILENMNFEEEGQGVTQGKAAGEEAKPNHPSMANPAMAQTESLLDTAYERIEAIIESKHYSKEEAERFIAALIETAELLSKAIKPQHKSKRKIR